MKLINWYKKNEQSFLCKSLLEIVNSFSFLPKTSNVVQLGAIKLDDAILPQYGSNKPIIIDSQKTENVNILADGGYLPLQSKSIDLMIIMHSFELCDDPQLLIREINRVLKDDGYVLVNGFNSRILYFNLYFKLKIKRIFSLSKSDEWFSILGFVKKKTFYSFKNKLIHSLFNNNFKIINIKILKFGRIYSCLYQKQIIPLTFDASIWQQKVKLAKQSLAETRNYD